MANAVDWLASDRHPGTLEAGEPLTWVAKDGSSPFTVTGPGGEAVSATYAGGLLTVPFTRHAGTYRVRTGTVERQVVVNPAAAESDLSRKISHEEPQAAALTLNLEHRELAPLLLTAALCLLAIESQRRSGRMRRLRAD
jgi:hypothetical protein